MNTPTSTIIYLASIVCYFILQYQAWRHWSTSSSSDTTFWIKANLMWTLGSKKQLTYGQIILHSVWGFMPITNTVMVGTQLGYMWVTAIAKICSMLRSNTWWNTPIFVKSEDTK